MGSKAVMALAGVAALALGGAAVARAVDARLHEARLLLPDGSVARVRYTGDVAPRLVLVPAALPVASADPFDDDGVGLAAFDRLAATMQAQAAAMLRQADLLATQPAAVSAPGAVSYSFVSTTSSDGGATCSSSVRVISLGDGKAPQVVRQSSGDCQPGGHPMVPAVRAAPPPLAPLVPVAAVGGMPPTPTIHT